MEKIRSVAREKISSLLARAVVSSGSALRMAFTIQHASPVAIRDRDACKQRRRRSAPRLGAARVRCCAAGTSSSPSPSASHQAQSAGVGIQGRRAAASSVIAAFVAGAGGAAFAKGPKTDVPVSGKAALGQIGEYGGRGGG